MDATREARRYSCGTYGFDGGASEKQAYKAKSFVRVILCMLDQHCPGLFMRLRYGDLAQILPDECQRCKIFEDVLCSEVQLQTGVSPLMLSCYTCCLNWASEKQLRGLLQASDSVIQNIVDGFLASSEFICAAGLNMYDQDIFPPGPHTIAETLTP